MKTVFTFLLLTLSVLATAQQSRSAMTSTSINDDDKTMSIQVEGTVNGKDISYNRRFNVAGMSNAQKNALKNSVFDSLGLGEAPKPPMPPAPPKPPKPVRLNDVTDGEETVTFVCKSCTGRMRLEVSGTNYSLTRETSSQKEDGKAFPMTVSMSPGEYRYTYWQNGVQQMQLPFTVKAGEKNEVVVK